VDFIVSLGEWLQVHPQVSGVVFVFAFAAIMAVGIPGGNLLMLSSGLLFGTLIGGFLASAGAVVAAVATHALIRTAFGRWLDERAGHARNTVRSFIEQGNAPLLVLPRLIPVIPFFAINVGLTAAGLPLRTYLWTTVVGVVPVAFLFASIGSEFRGMQDLSRAGMISLLLSPGLFVPLALLGLMTLAGWFYIRARRPA
jgi:uncharacterized membrane protein YdjX (TVP38/TMEM64 family)